MHIPEKDAQAFYNTYREAGEKLNVQEFLGLIPSEEKCQWKLTQKITWAAAKTMVIGSTKRWVSLL